MDGLFHLIYDDHFPSEYIFFKKLFLIAIWVFQRWIHHLFNYPLRFMAFAVFLAFPISVALDRHQLLCMTAVDNLYTTFVLNIF